MSRPGHHLAHSGEFFALSKLLLELLRFGNVAARRDHAGNMALFIKKRPGGDSQGFPSAIDVLSTDFDLLLSLSTGDSVLEHLRELRPILRTHSQTNLLANVVLGRHAENIF